MGYTGQEAVERFFKDAGRSRTPWGTVTPWGIVKNWLLLLRLLTALVGLWAWEWLRLCLAGLGLPFNRRLRQRQRLYEAARKAGSPEASFLLQELVVDAVSILFPGRRNS